MIGLLQRVSEASVVVDGRCIAEIECGLLVLIGVQRDDSVTRAQRLLDRVLSYRVFADEVGRMNNSLRDLGAEKGGLLLVPQFTLAADTNSGNRPSFGTAAAPAEARHVYESLVTTARSVWPNVASGVFGADMKVRLLNDGPVTFWLET